MPDRRRQISALLAIGAASMALAATGVAPTAAGPGTGSATAAAFPGAVGFGAGAEGGRGGDVAIVTSLADDGPGSLREAVESADGPRTITFEVSGTIDLASPLRITADHLTIAGQTSPGGITLAGYPTEIAGSSHVVLRHVRLRTGDRNAAAVAGKPARGAGDLPGDAADALSVLRSEHVVVDHVSASWGMDETLTVTGSADVTVQHSIISESLNDAHHSEGPHGYGSLVRGTGARGYTFAGNLWAHHQRRMPAIGGGQDLPPGEVGEGLDLDLVGNVMYDWLLFATHTLEDPWALRVHLEGNTYVVGPSLAGCRCALVNLEATAAELAVRLAGNLWDGDGDASHDPAVLTADQAAGPVTWSPTRFAFARPAPAVPDPWEAYDEVLCTAGASLPRDGVDARVVQQVRDRSGHVIDSVDDVGGYPSPVATPPAPSDLDRDGMPDDWELARALDPDDPEDRNGTDLDAAYTNLEVFLAERADTSDLLAGCPRSTPPTPTTSTTAPASTTTSQPPPVVAIPATPTFTG